jgi:Cd2+/Zn2+-exporting ATPase
MINTDPNHVHTYDAQGRMTCCTLEERIYTRAGAEKLLRHGPSDEKKDGNVQVQKKNRMKQYLPVLASLVMLLMGIAADNYIKPGLFSGYIRLAWYAIAYLPVGLPVIKEGWEASLNKEVFTEFTLMVLATIGAFAIGQYPEGVAVMLFYAIGELFQSAAVRRAKGNIKALLDVRPVSATVLRNNKFIETQPENVQIGETIQVKAGEKVPLDGEVLNDGSSFNTSALTGESKPKSIYKGGQVLAGMLNLDKVIELKVTKRFADSSLAKILDMVQNASARKAKTELMIRKFAKIYTPVVFFLAVALVVVPYFVVSDYVFTQWLYRALIFLVISCPCALVISIPLGYFGGIGAASKNGILFKGSNYLDLMTKVNTVVMDKTGTLTKGVFKVQGIITNGMDKPEFIEVLAALEGKSTHPIAKAIADYKKNKTGTYKAEDVQEIPGHGLRGKVNDKDVIAGNIKMLKKFDISYDKALDEMVESLVVVAINNHYAGYVLIADEIKEDAGQAVKQMHQLGIDRVIMLSGDKDSITQKTARHLGIDTAFGDLLPENKVQKVEELKLDKAKTIAFVGDGINDAPVLALSDVGIAMGALGSDAAIETANVIIQTDQPSKIATAIKIGKATKSIVIQNITLAFTVKAIVLVLGAGGLATMWEAVFADVGVALLAILNAVRIQKRKF